MHGLWVRGAPKSVLPGRMDAVRYSYRSQVKVATTVALWLLLLLLSFIMLLCFLFLLFPLVFLIVFFSCFRFDFSFCSLLYFVFF